MRLVNNMKKVARGSQLNFFFGKDCKQLLILFISLLLLSNISGYSQEIQQFDELIVDLSIPRYGVVELPIAIRNEEAFISVTDLFNILKIKNTESQNSSIISGYVINPEFDYTIEPLTSTVIYRDATYTLPNGFIVTPTTVYMTADRFGEIFRLDTDFNYRNLSITLTTDLELPVIKELRLEKMRKNLGKLNEVLIADTTLSRNYPIFKVGMVDWGIIATQQTQGENDTRLNLGLGAMIAGGETNILLNYSTRVPFVSKNQFYQWKYVNNESKLFKQVTAGKIYTRATSSLFAPVVGVQLTNSPVINRRSFGTYILSDLTTPNWTVELYINNVLVDFVQADASGFYTFQIPLIYGNTNVNLKFYGPYGEERIEERIINIPYNFVPKKEFEYTLSAGVVENNENSRFSRLNLNYGLTNGLTFGGGVEYLSGVKSGEIMPFVNTSLKLASNLLFSGEYTFGVKAEGLLSYRTLSNFQIDAEYAKYDEGQTAINQNYLEERKLTISKPIFTKYFSAFSRLSVNQIIMPTTEFTTAQFLLSGVLLGISTNFTTYGIFNERAKDPTLYSTISQTYRLPGNFLFSPQIQYNYSANNITNAQLDLEKAFFKSGFLNVVYENNFQRDVYNIKLGFRYIFDFAQTTISSRISNQNTTYVQSARGSFQYNDIADNSFIINNRNAVGKGGINFIPFLDYNYNGVQDDSEPRLAGVRVKKKSGIVSYNDDKTIITISNLQPYVNSIFEIDPTSLENIAWRVKNPIINIETVPNYFKTVYVPVEILGEVSGMVNQESRNGVQGLGRIIINILDENGNTVAKTLSEGDGYFTYLGLKAGKYNATIDAEQLENIGYTSQNTTKSFTIEATEFGDIVDDLEFVLEKKTD